jgi:hypothetical protein
MKELIIIIIFLMLHWKRARIHACIYMFDKKTHTQKSERKKGVAYDEAFAVVCCWCCWIIVTIASETEQFRRSFSFRMCL